MKLTHRAVFVMHCLYTSRDQLFVRVFDSIHILSSLTLTLLPFRKYRHRAIATIISHIFSADDNDAAKVECLSKII